MTEGGVAVAEAKLPRAAGQPIEEEAGGDLLLSGHGGRDEGAPRRGPLPPGGAPHQHHPHRSQGAPGTALGKGAAVPGQLLGVGPLCWRQAERETGG